MSRFFEDFTLQETIAHASPRTISEGDISLCFALYGNRHALVSSAPFARALGFRDRPLDDILTFNIIFGKSVPDISHNAIANLGYAQGIFSAPVYAGDTLHARSQVIGLRANKNGKSGIVMVRTQGFNQKDECVLSYTRWVMVKRRTETARPQETQELPPIKDIVAAQDLRAPIGDYRKTDTSASGSARGFADYNIGDFILGAGGTTLSQAEHMLATRLYQNSAQVHFDGVAQQNTPFGKRLVYGGHIIAHARALSFAGLENAHQIAAINGGTHAAPAFAEDTIYVASQILDKAELAKRADIGALRVRLLVRKGAPFTPDFQVKTPDDKYDPSVILDFDTWQFVPRF